MICFRLAICGSHFYSSSLLPSKPADLMHGTLASATHKQEFANLGAVCDELMTCWPRDSPTLKVGLSHQIARTVIIYGAARQRRTGAARDWLSEPFLLEFTLRCFSKIGRDSALACCHDSLTKSPSDDVRNGHGGLVA